MFVVDRIKDVINTGGVLVASREVEDALYTPPRGRRGRGHRAPARALDRGDHRGRRRPRATSTERRADRPRARATLAAHKVPKSVHFVDELPKNPSGKLLKRELRAQLGGTESAVGRAGP